MRLLGLPFLLAGIGVATGCFSEPPSSSTSAGSTADPSSGADTNPDTTTGESPTSESTFGEASLGETTFGTTFGETTFGTTFDTIGTSPSTGPGATTDGPSGPLLLFPRTCNGGSFWNSGGAPLGCNNPFDSGVSLDAYGMYPLGGMELDRVIEVTPESLSELAVDGVYEIDTTGFTNPVFRSDVACGDESGCMINYLITSEVNGEQESEGSGGQVVEGGDVAPITFNVGSEPDLVIHLNLYAPSEASESRFLWIDPRIVEGS